MGPPPGFKEQPKEPLPKHFNEIGPYIRKVWGGFFKRLFYIYSLVWETKPWIFFVMIGIAIFEGFMPLVGALIGKELLNAISDGIIAMENGIEFQFASIAILLVMQFSYTFVTRLVSTVSSMVNRIAGELVSNHIKLKICNKAKDVDLRSFDKPDFYERLENANREAGNRPLQILNSTLSIASTLISLISFVVVLWAVAPIAPLIITIIAIPSAVVNFKYRKKNVSYMRWHSKERRQMNYYSELIVNKDMVKEVKLFGLADTFIARYKEVFAKYFGGMKRLIYKENFLNMLITIFSVTVNCAMFVWIAYMVTHDPTRHIGDWTLYTGALSSISSSIVAIVGTTATVYEGTLFIDNMMMFMKEEKTVVSTVPEPVHVQKHIEHELRLENVSFRYPGMTTDVLHDINLTIKSGESMVLVGLNGAGKTTLIKLLTRLYDPTEGTIYLDGRDIKEYDVQELYSLFGIIFQDFGKYAVSVRENIAFGDVTKEPDDEAIYQAAVQSNANAIIDGFEKGLDTPLMRYFELDGKELSGGQWQKLAVARAFYGDSDILILDEPTASLDAIAEQEIFNQFEELRKGKMTVFVSHRLSSAVRASMIVVLSGGTIIEKGTHQELIAKGGVYHDLFLTQAERYIATVEDDQEMNRNQAHQGFNFGGDFPPMGMGPMGGDFRPDPNRRPPKDENGNPIFPPRPDETENKK